MELTFLDQPRDVSSSTTLVASLAALPAAPQHHVVYRGLDSTGIAVPSAFGGWLVLPATTVLALPGFEDAYEFVDDGALHTIFDLEKIIRMLLHGSHLAVEVLSSRAALNASEASVRCLAQTLNRRHLAAAKDSQRTLADATPGAISNADALEHLRRVAQGSSLSRGRLGMKLELLVRDNEWTADRLVDLATEPAKVAEPVDADTLEEIRTLAASATFGDALPANPSDYDALSNWLVAKRLGKQ